MVDFLLLFLLAVCAIAVVWMKDLLSATMVLVAYSLIMALIWARLNAVDVAFTEASVGAGITTVLLIATLSRTKREEIKKVRSSARHHSLIAFAIVLITGAVLAYGTIDMPDYGDPSAPAHTHVASRYVESSYEETGVNNFVTAVLASYRGYDTLGEVVVVVTAGISIVLLLREKRRNERQYN